MHISTIAIYIYNNLYTFYTYIIYKIVINNQLGVRRNTTTKEKKIAQYGNN